MSDDTTAIRSHTELVDGEDEEYRFLVVKSLEAPSETPSQISHYRNEVMLGEIATISLEKGSGKQQTVNLGERNNNTILSIYPNPAREEINLTVRGTERFEIIIVSAIGGEQVRFTAEGGKTVTLNTSGFLSGMYVARVRRVGAADAVVPFVVVR